MSSRDEIVKLSISFDDSDEYHEFSSFEGTLLEGVNFRDLATKDYPIDLSKLGWSETEEHWVCRSAFVTRRKAQAITKCLTNSYSCVDVQFEVATKKPSFSVPIPQILDSETDNADNASSALDDTDFTDGEFHLTPRPRKTPLEKLEQKKQNRERLKTSEPNNGAKGVLELLEKCGMEQMIAIKAVAGGLTSLHSLMSASEAHLSSLGFNPDQIQKIKHEIEVLRDLYVPIKSRVRLSKRVGLGDPVYETLVPKDCTPAKLRIIILDDIATKEPPVAPEARGRFTTQLHIGGEKVECSEAGLGLLPNEEIKTARVQLFELIPNYCGFKFECGHCRLTDGTAQTAAHLTRDHWKWELPKDKSKKELKSESRAEKRALRYQKMDKAAGTLNHFMEKGVDAEEAARMATKVARGELTEQEAYSEYLNNRQTYQRKQKKKKKSRKRKSSWSNGRMAKRKRPNIRRISKTLQELSKQVALLMQEETRSSSESDSSTYHG